MSDYISLVARIRYHIEKAKFCGLENHDATKLLIEAADALESAPAADVRPKWISVEERLPKEDEAVLTWGKHRTHLLDWLHDGRWCCFGEVTHWMPLPEPPEEEELEAKI